jgi:hypothetical protein
MKRTAIDAAGFFVALVAILSLLFIPTDARPTDDHTMKEVERYSGAPAEFKHDMCGGGTDQYGKTIAKWPCTAWFTNRDADGDRIVIFFDRKTGLLVGLSWMYANGNTSGPAEKAQMLETLHEKLHEMRDAAPVRKSAAKKVDT